jgi:hypothetical protein
MVMSSPEHIPVVDREAHSHKRIDEMTSTTRKFGRYCALAALAGGVIGAAAFSLAGMANAAPAAPTTTAPAPVGPGYQYYPDYYATPAPTQVPGWQGHHGPGHMN